MLEHWLIELVGHVSGLSEAQLKQIEKSLPATKALVDLLNRARPIIEQAQSLYIEAEPLIDQVKNTVASNRSPPTHMTNALWRPPLPVSTALSMQSVSTLSTEVILFIRCTWKQPARSQELRGRQGLRGLCTFQGSVRIWPRLRPIFAAAAKVKRRYGPHYPAAQSLSARQ